MPKGKRRLRYRRQLDAWLLSRVLLVPLVLQVVLHGQVDALL